MSSPHSRLWQQDLTFIHHCLTLMGYVSRAVNGWRDKCLYLYLFFLNQEKLKWVLLIHGRNTVARTCSHAPIVLPLKDVYKTAHLIYWCTQVPPPRPYWTNPSISNAAWYSILFWHTQYFFYVVWPSDLVHRICVWLEWVIRMWFESRLRLCKILNYNIASFHPVVNGYMWW